MAPRVVSPFGSFMINSENDIDVFVKEIIVRPKAVMDILEPALTSEKLTDLIVEVACRTSRSALFEAFQWFDVDGDGRITVEELKEGMTVLGDALTVEEADSIIRECDIDCDGSISFEEFLAAALT